MCKVICDMMGIDDKLFVILFGEVFLDENDMKIFRGFFKDLVYFVFVNKELELCDDLIW